MGRSPWYCRHPFLYLQQPLHSCLVRRATHEIIQSQDMLAATIRGCDEKAKGRRGPQFMSNNSQWLPAVVPLNRDSVIRKRHAPVRARPRLQTETTRTSNHALAWNLPP